MTLIESYKPLCAEYYDITRAPLEERVVEYYFNEIEKFPGRVLDAMCGNGRHIVPLVEKKLVVDGVDASQYMLDMCNQNCLAQGLKSDLYLKKIQNLGFREKYSTIIIPDSSLGLMLEQDELIAALCEVFNALKVGGQFICEIITPNTYQRSFKDLYVEHEVSSKQNFKIVLSRNGCYDSNTRIESVVCNYRKIVANNVVATEEESSSVKYYTMLELTNALQAVGFRNIKAYKPYTDEVADEKDVNLLVKCTK